MNKAEYVFCKWKKRLWPAKVLPRNQTSRKRHKLKDKSGFMRIEIFCLHKQVSVRCADVQPLRKETIQDIASKLDQNKRSSKPMEEVSYRRALREALDLLDPAPPSKDVVPSKGRRKKLPTQNDTLERDLLSFVQQLSPNKEQNTGDAPTPPKVTSITSKSRLLSSDPPDSKPVRCGPSGDGELAGQRRCRASKAKRAGTPAKELPLSLPRTRVESKKTCSSPVKPHEMADSPPSLALDLLAASNTLAVPSSPRCGSRSTPGGKKSSRRQKSLLASPMDGALMVSKLSEGEEASASTPSSSQYAEGSNGTSPKSHVISPPSRKRRRKLCLEDVDSGLSPEEPALEQEQEESQSIWEEQSSQQDFEIEEDLDSYSDLSLWHRPAFRDDDEEEDDELPSFVLSQQLGSIEEGKLVWGKVRNFPYWPAVVRCVKRKAKKASVIFIEEGLEEKSKGFYISLRNIKHFDCKEKQKLIDEAKANHYHEIKWCINLIEDYRIRVGCNSFAGSFLEYCSDAMSYPVRKEGLGDLPQMNFPQIQEGVASSSFLESTPTKVAKKLLPDRMEAARARANQKLVDFIVRAKGADKHLQSVLKREWPSRWLEEFLRLRARPYLTCIETYLEDESQQDLVISHLEGVYREAEAKTLPHVNGDSVRFILDVLFPEAIIFAISAVDQIDYKKAEEKYLRGPLLSQREREIFDEKIRIEKRRQQLQSEGLSLDDGPL